MSKTGNYYHAGFRPQKISIENLLEIIANRFNVSIDAMKSKSRKQPLADIRMIYMALANDLTNSSLNYIGSSVNRSHCNVIHSRMTVNDVKELKIQFETIKKELV